MSIPVTLPTTGHEQPLTLLPIGYAANLPQPDTRRKVYIDAGNFIVARGAGNKAAQVGGAMCDVLGGFEGGAG